MVMHMLVNIIEWTKNYSPKIVEINFERIREIPLHRWTTIRFFSLSCSLETNITKNTLNITKNALNITKNALFLMFKIVNSRALYSLFYLIFKNISSKALYSVLLNPTTWFVFSLLNCDLISRNCLYL